MGGLSAEARQLLQEAEERSNHNHNSDTAVTTTMNPLFSSIPRALTALFHAMETNRQAMDRYNTTNNSNNSDDDDDDPPLEFPPSTMEVDHHDHHYHYHHHRAQYSLAITKGLRDW